MYTKYPNQFPIIKSLKLKNTYIFCFLNLIIFSTVLIGSGPNGSGLCRRKENNKGRKNRLIGIKGQRKDKIKKEGKFIEKYEKFINFVNFSLKLRVHSLENLIKISFFR